MSFKAKNTNNNSKKRVLLDLTNYTKCITIERFDSKFLDLCDYDVNFTYGNHSINQDSAHWPMGFKMLRPMSGYLVRELHREIMRN